MSLRFQIAGLFLIAAMAALVIATLMRLWKRFEEHDRSTSVQSDRKGEP